MKKKILAIIMLVLGFGFIIYYCVLKYNIEHQLPTDALILIAASITGQIGLQWLCFKD